MGIICSSLEEIRNYHRHVSMGNTMVAGLFVFVGIKVVNGLVINEYIDPGLGHNIEAATAMLSAMPSCVRPRYVLSIVGPTRNGQDFQIGELYLLRGLHRMGIDVHDGVHAVASTIEAFRGLAFVNGEHQTV